MERVAVDRPEAQRVETELVRSRRPAPVVRGVFVVRDTGASTSARGTAGAIPGGDREPAPRSDGGGYGPPPPPVPFDPPGEGGRPTRIDTSRTQPPSGPPPEDPGLIQRACGAREALGEAGTALDPACKPGRRGTVRDAVEAKTDALAVAR